jgi:glycosyltransferase involved in cell wall biosynthesis
MKVLILSYHVPPDPAVGTLRVQRLVDAFVRAGHEVELIGPRWPDTGTEQEKIPIHRVARWPNAREMALAVRDWLRRRGTTHSEADGATPVAGWQVPANIPAWKRFLVAMALMPDDHQGFILPAAVRAVRLIRSRRFDLLYTSGPPHSAQVAGLLANMVTGVRWAAEFRDPWTDNAVQPRYGRSAPAFAMKRWLERRTFNRANHIVAVSGAVGRRIVAAVPTRASRIVVARNGIDTLPAAKPLERTPGSPTRLVYIGSLYHGRDPRPLFRAVAALIEGGQLAAADVRIDFFGPCRIYRGMDVQGLIDEHGLTGVVRLQGTVAQQQAVAEAASADVLLLLAQEQPLQVPNKLYEYLGSGRPILAFADEDGETTEMLRQVGGHFVVTTTDDAQNRETVRRALSAHGWTPRPSAQSVLAGWSARTQMDMLVQAIAPAAPDRASSAAPSAPGEQSAASAGVLRARDADGVQST